jgi:hypothetical protein
MMNTFLNFAFIPLIVVTAFRYFFALRHGIDWLDFRTLNAAEIYVFIFCGCLAALSFWHHAIRARCPSCKSTCLDVLSENEIDRFVGSKEVTGKDGQGRATRHHVSVTFAKLQRQNRCRSCGNQWQTLLKRELR